MIVQVILYTQNGETQHSEAAVLPIMFSQSDLAHLLHILVHFVRLFWYKLIRLDIICPTIAKLSLIFKNVKSEI